MDNVVEFKPRRALPFKADHVDEEKLQVAVEALPPQLKPQQPPVAVTAAQDVIRALAFYALQGNDGGELARKTLRGMSFVIHQQMPGKGVLMQVSDPIPDPVS